MTNAHIGPHRIESRIEQRQHRIPCRHLDQHDHERRPEHSRALQPQKIDGDFGRHGAVMLANKSSLYLSHNSLWYPDERMAIPNVKRYRITSPDGTSTASLMAVLPKDIDVNVYLSEAAQRFDWKAYQEAQAKQFKIRVGQQKQKKAK